MILLSSSQERLEHSVSNLLSRTLRPCSSVFFLSTYRWYSNVSLQNVINGDFQWMRVSEIIHDDVQWHVWKHGLYLMCLPDKNYRNVLTGINMTKQMENKKWCNNSKRLLKLAPRFNGHPQDQKVSAKETYGRYEVCCIGMRLRPLMSAHLW